MKKILLLIIIAAIGYGIYFLYQKTGDDDTLINPRLIDYINFPTKENPSKFFRSLKAVVVSLPTHPDKKENMDNIKTVIERALADDIDLKLIVFGEAILGTYNGGDKYAKGIAETIPGPLTNMLADFTMHYNIHIAAGLIELKDGKLFNSLVVVGPDGKVSGVHRKTLLHPIDEANGITKADQNYQVVEVDGFRFGLAIGDEINDKKLFEQYKIESLDGLICPYNTEIHWFTKWLNFWPYSKMYNAWILSAGRSGREGEREYDGTVFASSPGGYLDYKTNPDNYKMVVKIGK